MKYTNVVEGFLRGVEYANVDILENYKNLDSGGKNKINKVGDCAELYIKDLLCDSVGINDYAKKVEVYKEYLSYIGGSGNPPDCIIYEGEAIEIKKQENMSYADLSLNSSHPSDYLHSDSTLINKECRSCEDGWIKKNMVYAVVNISRKKKSIGSVWFAFGNCFASDKAVYEIVKNTIRENIQTIEGLLFKETNELGKVYNIGLLGICNLRIRGMWNMIHPEKMFGEYMKYSDNDGTKLKLIILKDDYSKLKEQTKDKVSKFVKEGRINLREVKIPSPNDRFETLEAIIMHN